MAAANPMQLLNVYMDVVLQITDPAVRTAINGQGLTSVYDFEALSEADVAEICTNARKPGGLIPNPDPAGVPAMIANPGVLIGHLVEKKLKMLRYYIVHIGKINRTFAAVPPTMNDLTLLYRFKEAEDEYDNDVELPGKLTSVDNIRVVLEDLDNYFERKRGVSGIPLAAYVRANPVVEPEATDPNGFGTPTILSEMIRRASHEGPTATTDMVAVWETICHVTHDGPGWGWVMSFARTRNGRAAYLALKSHYLGDAFQSRLRAKADQILESTYYDGSKRNYTYERYIETLQRAFTDLESTGETVSEERKVRILMTGTSDSRLESAKNQILATPFLRSTFENASNFLAEVLDSKVSYSAASRKQARISGVSTSTPNKGGGKNNKKNENKKEKEITDRYYKPNEWAKLSGEERQRVRDAREKRDKRRGVGAISSKPNKKPRQTDGDETPDITDESSESHDNDTKGVGAIMSQRKRRSV